MTATACRAPPLRARRLARAPLTRAPPAAPPRAASGRAGRTFTPTPMPELSTEPEDAAEAEDTPLEAENALLKALEEKRMVEEAEAEEEEAAE